MKKIFTILGILAVLSAIFVFAAKPNPGHNAPEVSGGTFSANDGDFVFPSSVDLGVGVIPGTKLHVSQSEAAKYVAEFHNEHATEGYGIYIETQDSSNTRRALDVRSNAGSTLGLSITNAGNVGVGTINPVGDLQINNRLAFQDFVVGGPAYMSQMGYNVFFNATSGNYQRIGTDEAARIFMVDGKIGFSTASSDAGGTTPTMTERLTILNDGSVGIGHSTPTGWGLFVNNGNARFASDVYVGAPTSHSGKVILYNSGTYSNHPYVSTDGNANLIMKSYASNADNYYDATDDHFFQVGGSTKALIDQNGHIQSYHNAITVSANAGTRKVAFWRDGASSGTSCNTQCGNGYCLGAYQDGTNTKYGCTYTGTNLNCICVGQV